MFERPPAVTIRTVKKGRILLADDEPALLRLWTRVLEVLGYEVDSASDGNAAAALFASHAYDVILSDISMPGMDGLQLLRLVRERDLDVPVVLMTGDPAIESAMHAIEYGALQYLVKPFERPVLEQVIERAVRLHKLARLKREAVITLGALDKQVGDRAGLEASFGRALATLWMAYQPIISWSTKTIYGYEALVRTREATLPHPEALFDAAERLDRLHELGRAIRSVTATPMLDAPPHTLLFVNLHTRDLVDETLFEPSHELSRLAPRVVLEITERASLHDVSDVTERIARLRKMGFRIAIDDLGAGYAGLTNLALLEPEVIKIDMSLSRDVHREPVKRKLVRSITDLCRDLAAPLVVEGVETCEERDTLLELGCDLMQGYLFARPGPAFPVPQY